MKDINQLYDKNSVTSKSRSSTALNHAVPAETEIAAEIYFFTGVRRYETEHIQE